MIVRYHIGLPLILCTVQSVFTIFARLKKFKIRIIIIICHVAKPSAYVPKTIALLFIHLQKYESDFLYSIPNKVMISTRAALAAGSVHV